VAENVLGTIFSRADALKRQLYDMIRNPSDYASMVGGRTQENLATAQALQNQAFSDPQNPLRITNPQALNQLTQMITSGPMGFAPAGITAFHGSPYLFRQFDPSKRGTGEGNQSYGVGAGYTAEARPVAETYIKNRPEVISKFNKIPSETVEGIATRLRYFYGDDVNAIAKDIKGRPEFQNISTEQLEKEIQKSGENFRSVMQSSGYLYKGDIPDEILPKFLDFDKPLKEQSKEVQNLANQYNVDLNDLGGDLLAKIGKNVQGTKIMEEAGIKGIRYFDQASRGKEVGTSNFIPFRAEDFKIQEINDIPLEDYIAKGLL
jgi:hypothetical protein